MMKNVLIEKHTGRNVVKTSCKQFPSINFSFVSALIAISLSLYLYFSHSSLSLCFSHSSLIHSNFFPSSHFRSSFPSYNVFWFTFFLPSISRKKNELNNDEGTRTNRRRTHWKWKGKKSKNEETGSVFA